MADSSSRNQAADPALPEKKRGRRRLVGAAVFLAGAAVIASLVFDHEPKPATPELAIKIPARDKSSVEPSASAVVPPVTGPSTSPNTPAAPTPNVPRQEGVVPEVPKVDSPKIEAPKVEIPKLDSPKQEIAKTEAPKIDAPKVEIPKVEAPKTEVAKVEPPKVDPPKVDPPKTKDKDPLATLSREANGSKVAVAPATGFMVQIGAFSSDEKLNAAVAKAKEAGFKVSTETIKTTNGERTRVRVGPFKSRESANAARAKLKEQGLDPALIAL